MSCSGRLENMSATFDMKVDLIMLEEVTGCRVVGRTEARTGKGKAMNQRGRGQGREALRKELREGQEETEGS